MENQVPNIDGTILVSVSFYWKQGLRYPPFLGQPAKSCKTNCCSCRTLWPLTSHTIVLLHAHSCRPPLVELPLLLLAKAICGRMEAKNIIDVSLIFFDSVSNTSFVQYFQA